MPPRPSWRCRRGYGLFIHNAAGSRSHRDFDPDRVADLEAARGQAYDKDNARLFRLLGVLIPEQRLISVGQGVVRMPVEDGDHGVLAAYLDAHPEQGPSPASVKVARLRRFATRPLSLSIVGPVALVGVVSSKRKAAASRANGRTGGRPALKRRAGR